MVSLNTNVSAMVAQRHLSTAASQVAETQKNLSSGFRINSASDDAAGMQIANTLHVQTRGLDVALTNAHSAYAVAETAEGALEEGSEILQRLRSLSLQAANGSNSDEDRQSLQLEVVVLKDEVERIARTTTFAGKNLFDGSYGSKSFHLGQIPIPFLCNSKTCGLTFLRWAGIITLPRSQRMRIGKLTRNQGNLALLFEIAKGMINPLRSRSNLETVSKKSLRISIHSKMLWSPR